MHGADDHTGQGRHHQGRQEHSLTAHAGSLHHLQKHDAGKGANDHDTVQGDVNDTGALRKEAAQGHHQQGNGKIHGLLDQEKNQFIEFH